MVRYSVGPMYAIVAMITLPCDAAPLKGFQISCFGARTVHRSTAEFCPMVDWLAGNLYNSTTFTMYTTGPPMSLNQQDAIARSLATSLLETAEGKVGDACRSAIQRLACVSAFPHCQTAGESASSVPHTPPCRLQCEQVNRICRPLFRHEEADISLDCGDYSLSRNCFIHVPHTKFLLDPQQGPYVGIPVMYIAVLIVWAILGLGWWYLTDVVYKEEALAVTRSLLAVPILRTITATAALVFWVECSGEGDMCSTNTASGLAMLYPFAEAVQMYFYQAAAKGWGVTRLRLSRGVWRQIAAMSFGFYLSHILLAGSLSPPSLEWIALTVSTYGLLYLVILRSACVEMAVLQGQSDKLAEGAFADAVRPLRQKCVAFRIFLMLLLVELCLEVACRYLLLSKAVSFFTLIALYEVTNAVAVAGIAACFMPRNYSAFHFMVPTSLECDGAPAEGVGSAGGGAAEDPRTERARRALTSRRRGRENSDDVESLEELRRGRASRDAQWWAGGQKGGYSETPRARDPGDACVRQEAEAAALLAEEEGHVGSATDTRHDALDSPVLPNALEAFAPHSSIDLYRLVGGLAEPTAALEAQLGGDPRAPSPQPGTGTGRRRDTPAATRQGHRTHVFRS